MRSARNEAFTLVEILVVISIIGILMSLAIPAITHVSRQMDRAQCSDNLRQIAIATANFELSSGSLPGYCQQFGEFKGGVDPADPGSFGGNVPRHLKIGGWQVAILAKLDQEPYYDRWALNRYPLLSDGKGERQPTTEGYSTIASAHVPTYQCPSSSGSIAFHGKNSYVANTGMHVDTFPFVYTRPGGGVSNVTFAQTMDRNNGVFTNRYAGFDPADPSKLVPVGRKMRSENFKDGSGNTMLVSESQQAQPWYLTRLTGNTSHLTNIATVGRKDVAVYPIESRYLQGAVWHYEDDRSFGGAPPVNPLHKINGGDVYETFMTSANFTDVARPSSLHTGGVNMAMVDGSVRFVVETIDYRTYQALLTPNGRSSDVPMNEFVPTNQL